MSRCPSEEILAAYAAGDVSADEKAAVGNHVKDCEACRAVLGQYALINEAAARVQRVEAAGPAAERIVAEAVRAAAAGGRRARIGLLRNTRWPLPLAASAAAVLLLVLFVWPLLPGGSSTTWAGVTESLSGVNWVHTITRNAADDGLIYELWYSPTARRSYTRWERLPVLRNWWAMRDYVKGEGMLYYAKERTVEIHDISGSQTDEGFLLKAMQAGTRESTAFDLEEVERRDGRILLHGEAKRRAQDAPGPRVRIWLDEKTMLPVRYEEDQPAVTGREAQSIVSEIDYPASGPRDIYELGIPRDVRVVDARPTPDAQKVVDTVNAVRESFPTRYAIATYSTGRFPWYNVLRDGDRVRVEMSVGARDRSEEEAVRLLREGRAGMEWVQICDGKNVLEALPKEAPPAAGARQPGKEETLFRFLMNQQWNPALISWPMFAPPVKLIQGDSPETAVMVGLEFENNMADNYAIHRLWYDPAHDYCLHRWEWYERKDSRLSLWWLVRVIRYERLANGRWYAAEIEETVASVTSRRVIVLTEKPQFAPDAFDLKAPWRTANLRVVDQNGSAVSDVRMASLTGTWRPQSRMEDGVLIVENVPTAHAVEAFAFTDAGLGARFRLEPGGAGQQDITVTMRPGERLEGFVREADGSPVAGLSVILQAVYGEVGRRVQTWGLKSVKTDSEGRYVLEGLVPEVTWRVEAFRNGWLPKLMDVTFDAQGVPHVADAVLDARAAVFAGRVIDRATRMPVKGAQVFLTPVGDMVDPHRQWQFETDAEGRWESVVSHGPESKCSVAVHARGYKWVDLGEMTPTDTMETELDPEPEAAAWDPS